MPSLKMNAKWLKHLKPGADRIDYFDTGAAGLVLRLATSGRKTWCYLYRMPDSRLWQRVTLGTSPPMTLAKARKEALARQHRVQIDKIDPAAEKKEAKRAETFGELAKEYLDKHAKKHKRSWQEDERMLNADVLPAWKHRKVREITRRDVRALLEPIAERAPVAANRVWALVSTMFNFAIRRDWTEANPASLIERQPETSRDRVLTHDEIRALWAELERDRTPLPPKAEDTTEDERPVPPMIARGLQVLLLTAQRPGEVFGMRWADLELPDDWQTNENVKAGWWTIPEAMSKNREAHRVPIGADVLDIVREAKATGPDDNRWVFAGIAGASVADRAKKAAAALSRKLGFEFHRHDLRRTAASEMAAAGIQRETIAKVLNHVDRGARMTAIYDRYSYDPEKRVALDTWTRRLNNILTEKPAAAVVPFGRGRA
ncbi:MAG: tyrosine-type recombinase/integrase [Vicinamibacterales bacterium]